MTIYAKTEDNKKWVVWDDTIKIADKSDDIYRRIEDIERRLGNLHKETINGSTLGWMLDQIRKHGVRIGELEVDVTRTGDKLDEHIRIQCEDYNEPSPAKQASICDKCLESCKATHPRSSCTLFKESSGVEYSTGEQPAKVEQTLEDRRECVPDHITDIIIDENRKFHDDKRSYREFAQDIVLKIQPYLTQDLPSKSTITISRDVVEEWSFDMDNGMNNPTSLDGRLHRAIKKALNRKDGDNA